MSFSSFNERHIFARIKPRVKHTSDAEFQFPPKNHPNEKEQVKEADKGRLPSPYLTGGMPARC